MRLAVAATVLATVADKSTSSSSSSSSSSFASPSWGALSREVGGGQQQQHRSGSGRRQRRRRALAAGVADRRLLGERGEADGVRRRRQRAVATAAGARPTALRSSVTTTTTTAGAAGPSGGGRTDATTTAAVVVTPPPRECDPYGEDVLGVLAWCGPGMYCVESVGGGGASPSATLGGTCVKDTRPDMGAGDTHRQLQDSGNDTNLIEDIAYLCYEFPPIGVSNNYNFTCECQGVDVEAYTGISSCSSAVPSCTEYQTKHCRENITQCYTFKKSRNITGPYEDTQTICTYYTSPETSFSCTGYTYTGSATPSSCSLQVEGVDCKSCGFDYFFDYFNDGNLTRCVVFDCTNTVFKKAGKFCKKDLAYHISLPWFVDELPCEGGCFVCDMGIYTDYYANVTVPGQGSIPCDLLDLYAISGLDFGAEFCDSPNRSIIEEQCGCPVLGGDDSPSTTDPTSLPPTKEDTAADTDTEGGSASTIPPTGSPGVTTPSGASTAMIQTTWLMGLVAAAYAAGMGLF